MGRRRGALNGTNDGVIDGTVGITADAVSITVRDSRRRCDDVLRLRLQVATATLAESPAWSCTRRASTSRPDTATGGVSPTPLNWTALGIGLDLSGAISLSVGGTLGVSIANGFVAAAGTFRLERFMVSGGGLTSETALKLSIMSASLWAGVGGGLNATHTAVVPGLPASARATST